MNTSPLASGSELDIPTGITTQSRNRANCKKGCKTNSIKTRTNFNLLSVFKLVYLSMLTWQGISGEVASNKMTRHSRCQENALQR